MAGTLGPGTNQLDINWVKTDSLGNLIWSNTIGTPNNDHSFSYIKNHSNTGDYIITSAFVKSESPVDLQAYIAKISGSTGNIIWSDTIGTVATNANEVFSSEVEILPNGDIVAIGGITDPNNFGVDGWLIKYNGNGEIIWERIFDKYGGPNDNYFWDIHQTYDDGFIICGDLTDVANGVQKLWVLKLDSMGCEVANCSVGVKAPQPPKGELVYPNPTTGVINIALQEIPAPNTAIQLFDITGTMVLSQALKQTTTQLNINNYPKGIYLYQISNSKQIHYGKIIVQ